MYDGSTVRIEWIRIGCAAALGCEVACYHPVTVGIKRKPAVPGGARVLDDQTVPCGHCLGCRTDQARQWAIRITHEAQVSSPAYFLTLTYDETNLPHNGSLEPQDLTAFLKRLRHWYPPGAVRYYACGEYGEHTQRPHYHAVLFGASFPDRVVHRSSGPSTVWRSDFLDSVWTHGFCEFSAVTWNSASYVAGYVRKKVRHQDDPEYYTRYVPETGELVELVPEFARMSRRPALGLKWLQKYWRDVYPRDHVTMNGLKLKPPRYYDRAFEDERHVFPGISLLERRRMLYDVKWKRWDPDLDVGPEVLANRETNHAAKVALFQSRDGV